MEHFGLRPEEEKSRMIKFGHYAQENAEKRGKKAATFNSLGFIYCYSKSGNGRFRVKKKTSKKKYKEMYWIIQGIRKLSGS